MIKICNPTHLPQCVEIAFERNNRSESNCSYCPKSKENIGKDFDYMMNHPDCLMVGSFIDDTLTGFIGFFVNPDNQWADCVGPFFKDEWNSETAMDLFLYGKTTLESAVRFNFFFDAKNTNCHQFMEALSAGRHDNEYILYLNRADYQPQTVKHSVIPYTSDYEADVINLHDHTSPDIYVTGKEIIATIGKTRDVFCALDEDGIFAGYGVLKHDDDSKHLTAEIFAVREEKRGKGYGWALLNAVVDTAFRKYDGNSIDLVVDKLNTGARNLYYACGFRLMVENEAFSLKV